jgi:hypothetical protein
VGAVLNGSVSLYNTLAEANVGAANNAINLSVLGSGTQHRLDHVLAPITGLAPGQDYYAIRSSANDLKLANSRVVFDGSSSTAVNLSNNTIQVTGTWVAGDAVVYSAGSGGTAITGLTESALYYVGSISGGTVKLYTSSSLAIAGAANTEIDLTVLGSGTGHQLVYQQIALTPQKTTAQEKETVHSLIKTADLPITNLVDGVTYYVKLDNIPAGQQNNRFQLANANGVVIDIAANALSTSPLHSLGTEAIDLTAASGQQTLRIDLTSTVVGADTLLGPGGLSLALLSPPSGDNISSGAVKGSSGAFISVGVNSADVRVTPNVSAFVAADTVQVGNSQSTIARNVTIESILNVNTSVNGYNGAGGFVAVGEVRNTTTVDADNTAYVAAGTAIDATGNVSVRADADYNIDTRARARGGGFVDNSKGYADSNLDYTNIAELRSDGVIRAGGNVELNADTAIKGFSRGTADSGGVGADADAKGFFNIGETTALTQAMLAANTKLFGDAVAVKALVSNLNVRAESEADADGLVSDSDTESNVTVHHESAEVRLAAGSRVEADDVDLTALHGRYVNAQATPPTFVGVDVSTNADSDANGLYGDAGANAETDYESSSKIDVAAGSAIAGSDVTATAEQLITRYDISRRRDIGEFGSRGGNENGDFNAAREIIFNGDIELSIPRDPELFIDASGNIVAARTRNVTVNGGQSTGAVTGNTISVDNIVNTNPAGTALLQANNVADQDSKTAPASTISGTLGTIRVKTTYDLVTITNLSGKDLQINNISPANPGATGQVTLNAKNVTAQFGIADASGPTLITIDNNNVAGADVVLNGLINNPTGGTVILAGGGTITDTSTGIIRTNELDLDAQFVGVAPTGTDPAQRLNVELVRSPGRPTDLTVDSNGGIYIDLTGRLREPTANATFDTGTLKAAGTIDVALNPAVQETAAIGVVGGITVTVTQDPNSSVYYNRFRHNVFNPTAAGVLSTANNTITVTHSFAAGDKVIYYNGGGTSIQGLANGGGYFVGSITGNTFKLFNTRTDALNGTNEINLESGAAGSNHVLASVEGIDFDPTASGVVSFADNTINAANSFVAGNSVIYRTGGGTSIQGLTNNGVYYIGARSGNLFKLFNTRADALAGTNEINLESGATGIHHTLAVITGLDAAIYATGTPTPIAGSYDFDLLTAGGNIVIKAASPGATQTRVNVKADTDVPDTGYIDVLTNGSIDINETVRDLRILTIQSNAGDVSLAAARSIFEIADDPSDNGNTPWVIGNGITLLAQSGGIGKSVTDLLEINSAQQASGAVDALAHNGVFLKETAGNLSLSRVVSQTDDVLLQTLSGSILEGGNDLQADIQGTDIDLITAGGGIGATDNAIEIYGAGTGQAQNTLQADQSVPCVGRL